MLLTKRYEWRKLDKYHRRNIRVSRIRGKRILAVEFIASKPGSSFEGLQESIINYGDPPNRMPEFITALHEMSAVDMASGYGKAEGRPMAALLHGTLGIQNASMAIFQAFSGSIPRCSSSVELPEVHLPDTLPRLLPKVNRQTL